MSSSGAAVVTASAAAVAASKRKKRLLWPIAWRWKPISTDHIIASEKRLLSLVKTPYKQERVDIGSGSPGSKIRWFRLARNATRFINTVTFHKHGYGASQGFFFRNFDALAKHFKVIAIDQLGWGGSSRPDFTCKSTEETEAWFIDSLEEWRKAKNLSNFILLGHSFGGYVASRYAIKVDSHHFLFLASARGLGPWGKRLVRRYTNTRFGLYSETSLLSEEETRVLTDNMYHTVAAKASGELCLKYIFSYGAVPRMPLLQCAAQWKVPTTFIYGAADWMDYRGAQAARKNMKVPCEIIRVPQAWHFVFIDDAAAFHSAVLYACRKILLPDQDEDSRILPPGVLSV